LHKITTLNTRKKFELAIIQIRHALSRPPTSSDGSAQFCSHG